MGVKVDPEDIATSFEEQDLAVGLEALALVQSIAATVIAGDSTVKPGNPATREMWMFQVHACQVELQELLDEIGWKPWKEDPPFDRTRIIYEFGDVLAFLGNLVRYLNAVGISSRELAAGYRAVAKRNVRRARGKVQGYVPRAVTEVPKGV